MSFNSTLFLFGFLPIVLAGYYLLALTRLHPLRLPFLIVATRGMRMIEPAAIKGAGDFWCNFLSPASTRGINIEFVQPF